MHCQIKLVAMQRNLLSKERKERQRLSEKIVSLEKSIKDLTDKNTILEKELYALTSMNSPVRRSFHHSILAIQRNVVDISFLFLNLRIQLPNHITIIQIQET